MKNKVFIFLPIIAMFCSCSVVKNAQMNEDFAGSKDKAMKYFVVYKDGKKVQLNQFKSTEPLLLGNSKIILDDGTKVSLAEVQSYQSETAFYTRSSNGTMVTRIKKGLLNVYMSREIVGTDRGKPEFAKVAWVQKGDKEKIVKLKLKNLKELVSDYEPSLEMVNQIKSSLNYKAMDEAIDEYNFQKRK